MVYEARGLGTIFRCPVCDYALIRLAHARGRNLVDPGGTGYLGQLIGNTDERSRRPC